MVKPIHDIPPPPPPPPPPPGWGNTAKASDRQEGGDHYKTMGDFQPWDVLQHWLTPEEYRGYQKGVAIAYLARERQKGGDQDIKKAAHHLQRLIEALDEQAKPYVVPQAAMDVIMGNPPFAAPTPCCGQPDTCSTPCVPREQARAGSDGWITWTGGECPVPDGVRVEVQLRRGTKHEGWALRSECMRAAQWLTGYPDDPRPSPADIVAYRIITNG